MSVVVWMIAAGYILNAFAITAFAAYNQFAVNCKAKGFIVCVGMLIPYAAFIFAYMFAKEA